MLYVIIGEDPKARIETRHKLWKKGLEEFDLQRITAEELVSLANTRTLIDEPRGFFLRGIFSQNTPTELKEGILEIAKELVHSHHTFIIEEEKILAKSLERFKKAGATIESYGTLAKKERFNVFGLSGALGQRDRKKLWLLLMSAFEEGLSAENIAGVLAWKARTALASSKTKEDRAPFEKISRDLVVLYHDSHRGVGDLELLLERFVLTL